MHLVYTSSEDGSKAVFSYFSTVSTEQQMHVIKSFILQNSVTSVLKLNFDVSRS
jgi:hypothetical protein